MAHRRRHRRGFGGYISVPSFSGLAKDLNPLGKHVASTDLFVGAGLGLALGGAVRWALNKANAAMNNAIPMAIMRNATYVSTFLAGVGLYMFERNKNRARAEGHFVGATLAAAGPFFWGLLGSFGPKMADGTPFFSEYVMVPYGLLTADSGMGGMGLLTADQQFRGSEDWDPLSAP